MTGAWNDDDQVFAWLSEATAEARGVPADFVAAGRAAYAWHDVDADLAALAYDSAELAGAAPAAVRAERAAHRNLTFSSTALTIELEVDGRTIRGQLVPPDSTQAPPGEVTIQVLGTDDLVTPVDELGYFAVEVAPQATFRLRCRLTGGATVVTGRITPA
jgi:hypothetical protein